MDLRQPSAGAFAQALDFAASAQVRDRAQGLGEIMRAENGVVDAVVFLERIVARSKTRSSGNDRVVRLQNWKKESASERP